MDNFQVGLENTTVLYFPLIDQKYVRKNDILQLTNGRCKQAEVDGVLDSIEAECGHFEMKKRMLGRNRICLSIFILSFVSGLTTVMISSGVDASIGFYVGIGIVTLALLLVFLILLINRMLNHVEAHYLQIIQSRLEHSNEKIGKGGAHWNTRAINLNYLELRVVEDHAIMKQILGSMMKSIHHNHMIIEEEKNEGDQVTDRNRIASRMMGKSQKKAPKNADSDEDKSGTEEDDDDDDDDDDDEEDEEEDEDEEDEDEDGSEEEDKKN